MPRKKDLSRMLHPEATAEMEASTRVQISDAPQPTRTGRLRKRGPLPVLWVRIPLPWFTRPHRGRWRLSPSTRLLCLLLHETGEGQRPLLLSNQRAAEIGLSRFAKRRALAELEADGFVRVERADRNLPQVWLLRIV